MKQMDRVRKLFGNGGQPVSKPHSWYVEYDHPFQKVVVDSIGRTHIIEPGWKTVCGGKINVTPITGETVLCRNEPHPCPICFMQGDLAALKVSEPERTSTEDRESHPKNLDACASIGKACARAELDELARLLSDGQPAWEGFTLGTVMTGGNRP